MLKVKKKNESEIKYGDFLIQKKIINELKRYCNTS